RAHAPGCARRTRFVHVRVQAAGLSRTARPDVRARPLRGGRALCRFRDAAVSTAALAQPRARWMTPTAPSIDVAGWRRRRARGDRKETDRSQHARTPRTPGKTRATTHGATADSRGNIEPSSDLGPPASLPASAGDRVGRAHV